LEPGEYSFCVINSAGCSSALTEEITITQPKVTPPVVAEVFQPDCENSTGSVQLEGLPSIGEWTLKPGGISGTGVSVVIDQLSPGAYYFAVISEYGCGSDLSEIVTINEQPSIPQIPLIDTITQPTCSIATGSVILNGLPSGNWLLNPGSVSGYGSEYTLQGLNSGTYTFSVSNEDGCISGLTFDIIITHKPDAPSSPVIGPITHPTCSLDGSVFIYGLPSVGNWTLIQHPDETFIVGSGTGVKIDNLTTGNYTFSVSNETSCISESSATVAINPKPQIPLLVTSQVKMVSPTDAVGGGMIISDGGDSITAKGVCWSTSPGPIVGSDFKTSDGAGNKLYSSFINGLIPGQTYYVRSYATNCAGTGYGSDSALSCPVGIEYLPISDFEVYPNPFIDKTTISYSIPKTQFIEIAIFDQLGRRIETLIKSKQESGDYQIIWETNNIATGVYHLKLITTYGIVTKQLVIAK